MYYIVIQESIRLTAILFVGLTAILFVGLTAILLNSTRETIEQDKSSKIASPIFYHDIIEVTTVASFL